MKKTKIIMFNMDKKFIESQLEKSIIYKIFIAEI